MARLLAITACLVWVAAALACSNSPVHPATGGPAGYSPDHSLLAPRSSDASAHNRYLWGYWTIRWDPVTGEFEATPERGADIHLNIRRFLEDTMCTTCLVIGDNHFNDDGDLELEITIRHPKSDPVFTGFDVRGIAIFMGTYNFPEQWLLTSYHDNDEYMLVNADGFTELWSPFGFPPGSRRPIFEYSKGTYANHGAHVPTTLNGFMCFHTLSERHAFQAGGYKSVWYTIRFPEVPTPLEFGYSVDASWAKPVNMTDPEVPDDFPIWANSIEAHRITAEFDGVLSPLGGSNSVLLRIYDWQGADTINQVMLEAPDLFNGTVIATFSQATALYAEYTATIHNQLLANPGTYPVLVCATDTQPVPVVGYVDAYNIFLVEVHPVVELEQSIEMDNFPVEAEYDTTSQTCYFGPLPGQPDLRVLGINSMLQVVTGFPTLMATGGIGICRGARELFVATDLGEGWPNDITVLNIDTKNLKRTIDIPSLIGNPGCAPLDLIVNENMQEVWVTLWAENQVATFFANVSAPDITRIDVGTGPGTLAIDTIGYKVFAACEGNDTVAVIDGFSHELDTITLQTPLESPDPLLPALAGIAYVRDLDMLYITTLLAGKVDFYSVADLAFQGSIQLVTADTEAIVGLVYDSGTGFLYATGQMGAVGHVWAINPVTNQVVYEAETTGVNPSFPAVSSSDRRLFVPDPAGLVDVFKLNS